MTDIYTTTTTRSDDYDDIFDLMRDLQRENPGLKMKKLVRKWCDVVRDDPDMNDSALKFASLYVYNASLSGPRRKRKTVEARKARARRSLFSMTMPNGKPLGDCTFGEVAKFGNGFVRLSQMGKPDELVRDKLTQAQVRKVLG